MAQDRARFAWLKAAQFVLASVKTAFHTHTLGRRRYGCQGCNLAPLTFEILGKRKLRDCRQKRRSCQLENWRRRRRRRRRRKRSGKATREPKADAEREAQSLKVQAPIGLGASRGSQVEARSRVSGFQTQASGLASCKRVWKKGRVQG